MNFKKKTILNLKLTALMTLTLMLLLTLTHSTGAAINPMINFAGKVTNLDGSELADGVYNFSFGLYTTPTGGAAIWDEDLTAANMFSATISAVTVNADSITYGYGGDSNASTLRVGQYLFNEDTDEAVLIIDTGAGSVTTAGVSPAWSVGEAINNRPFVEGGVIDINLGSVSDLTSVDFNQQLYLEITFNGEIMQPRKNVASVYQSFESASLGGKTESEFAALGENETVTGQWSFNNILSATATSAGSVLTVTQNGAGNIADFKAGTTTALAVLADGRVQIGNYYFPTTHGLAGYNLKTDLNGNLYWGADLIGGGDSSGLFSSSTDVTYGDIIFESDVARKFVIGNNTLTGPVSTQFEVEGLSWLDTVGISAQNVLRFYDTDSSNYYGLRATGTLSGDFILTLPGNLGTAGQALLTNADGNLYWGSISGFTYVNPGIAGQTVYYAADGSTLTATSTIFVSPEGRVGIGTTTPSQLFAVGASNGNQFLVDATGQVVGGTWAGNIVAPVYGGTGTSTWTNGALVYASSANVLGEVIPTTDGYILQLVGGRPAWVATSTLGIDFDTISGILPIIQGGTGTTTAAGARINLGLEIGVDIQGYDPDLGALSALAHDGTNLMIVSNGAAWTTQSTSTVRTTLGLSEAFNLKDYFITTAGTPGYLWSSDGGGAGQWIATSSLNIDLTHTAGILSAARGGTGWDSSTASGVIVINNGAWGTSTTLPVSRGGTGTTTYTTNSLIYASAANTLGEILPGSNDYVLSIVGGVPTWVASSTGASHSLLSAAHPDTTAAAPLRGAIITGQGGTPTWSRLTLGSNGSFLTSDGTDIVWATDPMSVAYGGTGSTSLSGLLKGNNTGAILTAIPGVDYLAPSSLTGLISSSSIGVYIQAYDSDLGTIAGFTHDSSGLMIVSNGLEWITQTPSDIRTTLELTEAYDYKDYFITTEGTNGYLWSSDGSGPGQWISTSSLNLDLANTVGTLSTARGGTGWNSSGVTGLAFINTGSWDSTSTVSVIYGGTGVTTLAMNGVLFGNGQGPILTTGQGTNGYILQSVNGVPTWVATTTIGFSFDAIGGILSIEKGGTGADNATSARMNLGLDDIYKFGITSTGTTGWLWQSDGDGQGRWVATTSLGITGGSGITSLNTFIGTTTYTTDGNFATSSLVGYRAGNDICNYEYPDSHFCSTHEILYSIYLSSISDWGSDTSNAWIAEGPPGYTYDSNDCNGYTDNAGTKLGAFWLFNSAGGGSGWLVNCTMVKPLACCKAQ